MISQLTTSCTLCTLCTLTFIALCGVVFTHDIKVTLEWWHRDLLASGVETTCRTVLEKHSHQSYTTLTEDATGEILHCLMREVWLKQTSTKDVPLSTCDVLMKEYDDWTSLDPLTKRVITECVTGYMMADSMRLLKGLEWIPRDLFTNPMRKWTVLDNITQRLGHALEQYAADQSVNFTTFKSVEYRERWSVLGLNTTHYEWVTDEQTLAILQKVVTPLHYITDNFRTEVNSVFEFGDAALKEMGPLVRKMAIELAEAILITMRFGDTWQKMQGVTWSREQLEKMGLAV